MLVGFLIHDFLDTERLEQIASQNNFRFELLGFDQGAIVLNSFEPLTIDIKSFKSKLRSCQEDLNKLKKLLTAEKADFSGPMLFSDPQWTRHGEPINYVNL